MFPSDILDSAGRIIAKLRAAHLKVATAESCTGGLVAGAITSIAGSSDVFDQGFVTYANSAKTAMVGVDAKLIREHGAVSAEVAHAMAEGGLKAAAADVAVAITGVAGPTGGTAEKPVGLVHFAAAKRGGATTNEARRFGDIGRHQIRIASVEVALNLLRRLLA